MSDPGEIIRRAIASHKHSVVGDAVEDRILLALRRAGYHLHRWQDISEAPKDGTAVILLQPWMSGRESMVIGHYANGWVNQLCLYCSHDQEKEFGGEVGNEVMHCDPTHFAPLPPAPPEPGR